MNKEENCALVIWLTGLAGSGKSTIGRAVYEKLRARMKNIVYLDGDELREILSSNDYSKAGRIAVAKSRSNIAHFLSNQGIVVVVTTISMFDEIYAYNRARLKNYFEIYVKCEMSELMHRDQKGLYTSALRGEIENVVGVDIDFDEPNADLVVENSVAENLDSKAEQILEKIDSRILV